MIVAQKRGRPGETSSRAVSVLGVQQVLGVPCFSKVFITSLHFYERPVLLPVLVTERKLSSIFILKKGKKQKQRSAFVLQQAVTEAMCTLSSESGT